MDKFEGGMYFFVKNIEFNSFNQIINSVNLKILEHGLLNAGKDWNFPGLNSPFNRLYFVISGVNRQIRLGLIFKLQQANFPIN